MAAAHSLLGPDMVDTISYDKTHHEIRQKIGTCLIINNYLFLESEEFVSGEGPHTRSIPADYLDADSDDEDNACGSDCDGYSSDEDEERNVSLDRSLLNSRGLTPKLGEALYKVGFNIRGRPNRTKAGMKNYLKKFAKSKGRRYDKAVIIIIMSHGSNGYVEGSDENETLNLNKVFGYFTGKECPALKGKPKIFMIDACRQKNPDGEKRWKRKLGKDMTLVYSTTFDTSALDGPKGSYFARALMGVLEQVVKESKCIKVMKMINLMNENTKEATKGEQIPVVHCEGNEPTFKIKRRVP